MDTNEPMVTGLFRDRDSAERAYQSVSDRGYSREDVNLVMSDETRKQHFSGTTVTATRPSSAPRQPRRRHRRCRRQPRCDCGGDHPRSDGDPLPASALSSPAHRGGVAGASAGAATSSIIGALDRQGIPGTRQGVRRGSAKAAS
jgi:hypothetical protein